LLFKSLVVALKNVVDENYVCHVYDFNIDI